MTILVGQDGAGWGAPVDSVINSAGGDSGWKTSGYSSVAAGEVQTAYVYIADWSFATAARVYVYSAADALLATSASLDAAGGTGLRGAALSLTIPSAGVSYKLVFRPDAGYPVMRVRDASSPYETKYLAMTASYPTGDATLAAGTDNAYPEFIIWLDGTAGGGASNANLIINVKRSRAG